VVVLSWPSVVQLVAMAVLAGTVPGWRLIVLNRRLLRRLGEEFARQRAIRKSLTDAGVHILLEETGEDGLPVVTLLGLPVTYVVRRGGHDG
jgi:hypothetical protein